MEAHPSTGTIINTLSCVTPPRADDATEVMTQLIEVPPNDPGAPPHRHSGPVFAYMVEGEIVFELEGEPERIIKAGESFWEPGGDVIHYQAANITDGWARFLAVCHCVPGQPMLTFPTDEELSSRAHLRHPR